jgi:hypothetical protein
MADTIDPLIYPIGRPVMPEALDHQELEAALRTIEGLPERLRTSLAACDDLDRPIRPGAWSPRTLVHHLADTHLHTWFRTKLALVEEEPTVPAYDVNAWAQTPDAAADVEGSLCLLEGVHTRWVDLVRRLSPEQLERRWRHPTRPGLMAIWQLAFLYSWHGEHHRAQIEHANNRAA